MEILQQNFTCSTSTIQIKAPERTSFTFYILWNIKKARFVNFEHISYFFIVFLLLTFNIHLFAGIRHDYQYKLYTLFISLSLILSKICQEKMEKLSYNGGTIFHILKINFLKMGSSKFPGFANSWKYAEKISFSSDNTSTPLIFIQPSTCIPPHWKTFTNLKRWLNHLPKLDFLQKVESMF